MTTTASTGKSAYVPAATLLAATLLLASPLLAQQPVVFTPGNLVVVVEGCGVNVGSCPAVPAGTGTNGTYGDNQAAPFNLFQFAPMGVASASYIGSTTLPQVATGANFPIVGEYGSSSEGNIALSGNGQFLTIAGYGVNPAAFDQSPTTYGTGPTTNALGQSGSLTTQTAYTPVPRVVALIDAFGNVNSTSAIYNIFNTNNPRSAFSASGTTAYLSGQGAGKDATAGVFLTPLGAPNLAPTPISGLDTTSNTYSQDTRQVQIVNNTLYVSIDSKGGSNAARSFVATLGTPGTLPTATVPAGPVMLTGFGNTGGTGKVTITNNGNNLNAGLGINVSPSSFFFATPTILYVADTGNGKQTSAASSLGDGGLQKWINSAPDGSGTWSLAYTLYQGLNLVKNTATAGTTGLYGLTGVVSGTSVNLYATNATINDLDPTFLYGIADTLASTTPAQAAAETFTQLAAAPADSNFKGVSFAPVNPTPTSPVVLTLGRTLTRANGLITVAVNVADTGGTAATNVVLTSVKVGGTAATPLPLTVTGVIPAGSSATASVSVPATVGASGAASSIVITGTYNGGSFTSSARVTLP